MKKLVSIILTLAMIFSLAVPVFATADNYVTVHGDIDLTELENIKLSLKEGESIIDVTQFSSNVVSAITKYDNADGSTTYTYYENGAIVRTYTFTLGSGYYKVKEYADDNRNVKNEQIVYVSSSIDHSNNVNNTTATSDGYNYWGTVNYYNAYVDKTYSIYCRIKEDVDQYANFSPAAYYADKAVFIASVVLCFVSPGKKAIQEAVEKAAQEVFDTAIKKGFLSVVLNNSGDILQIVLEKNFSLKARETKYHILGIDADGKVSKEFKSDSGYDIYIYADQGFFSKTTYYQKWTRNDWGNETLGRMMAWDVFGIEYNPTSWSR